LGDVQGSSFYFGLKKTAEGEVYPLQFALLSRH
jgi:hypothetical protein